ncbi:MAG: diacylglycerol/polyprenol kinase family protein, partial [Promethearchaeota archaeon]
FTNPFINDLVLIIGAYVYVGAIIVVAMSLKKKGVISGHAARKIVHLFSGFSCFIVPFLYTPLLAMIVAMTFLLVLRYSRPSTQVFEMMGEKDEREKGYLEGPFSYALSINILVLIFSFMPRYFFFPAASIMVMMISDTAASFFGRRYGKHEINIKYTNTTRTLEGSLALFISAFLLSIFAFNFFGYWFPGNTYTVTMDWVMILSLLLAGLSTIIELISPSNIDDLIVPIIGCFATFIITILAFPSVIGL